MTTEIEKTKLLRATHSGLLKFANVECHVLEDGTRVVTQRGVLRGIGANEKAPFGAFVDRIPNKPADFTVPTIPFRLKGGGIAHGVTAQDFAVIITCFAHALVDGSIHHTQRDIGLQCASIAFALMGNGLVDAIDDATGFRGRTPANALEQKLKLFLLDEPAAERERRFPPEFWHALARVYGVTDYVLGKNPPYFQMFVRRAVHDVVDAEVAQRIKARNPSPRDGSLHYQHYTDPALAICDEVIRRNITVLRGSSSPADFWMRHANEFRGAGLQLSFGAAE
jgi:hypothetical protein